MTGFDIVQDIRAHIAKVLRAQGRKPDTYKLAERKVGVLARWLTIHGPFVSDSTAEQKLREGKIRIKGVRIVVGA